MNTNKPKISIVCPSYNLEKYVRYYIESILKQTEQDFELIIVDDFSEDNNVQEIKKFSDPRIKLIEHDYNKGLNASLNDAMNVANSDLISFIASDDILEPNYIERVLLEFEQKDISVAYVALQYINEKNSLLKGNVMLPVGLSRFQILKKSFEGENQIPSPGMVMKKSAINPFLPLPVGLLQYQDWQMHNYLLMENEISLINEKLIRYRISPDSASACSDKVVARSKMETTEMMDVFLRIKDVDLLKKIFADDLDKYGKPVNETIPYFLARLALDSPIKEKQHWGIKQFYTSFQNKEIWTCSNLCMVSILNNI
jgi:glycosyltransferase involved in cell wall biosynthesis